jgi:DNA topoisomerase-1
MTERGSAVPLVLAIVAIGFLLMLGAQRLATATGARAHADAAADATALAAADALALGKSSAAARADAAETAKANGARLMSCACAGRDAEVEVALARPVDGRVVRARAHATVDAPDGAATR